MKINWNKIYTGFLLQGFLASLMLSFTAMYIFSVGWHNVDICHNGLIWQEKINQVTDEAEINRIILMETNLERNDIDLFTCYKLGLKQIYIGFFGFGLSAFFMGMCLIEFIMRVEHYARKDGGKDSIDASSVVVVK